MHKIAKIFVISILICAISFSTYATEIKELQEEKENIQNQLNESSNEMKEVDDELTDNLQEIQKLDEKIENTEKSLSDLNQQIDEKQKQVDEIQSELIKIKKKYFNQKSIIDERLVAMYETGKIDYLDVLLSSKSISDFLSTYFLLSELAQYDIDLLEIVGKEQKIIEEKNEKVTEEKNKLDESKKIALKTQVTLSNIKLLRNNYISKLNDREREIQNAIDEYQNQIKIIESEIKSLVVIKSFGEEYSGGEMAWPINGYYNVTSNYGMRVHPITGVYKLHTGVDIGAPYGSNFTAIANGIVVKAEYNTAYGNMVILDHGGGVQTLYAHGSEIMVELGQEVVCGDIVLKVGSTGYSTGPHAHFEVRVNGEAEDPLNYIKISEE